MSATGAKSLQSFKSTVPAGAHGITAVTSPQTPQQTQSSQASAKLLAPDLPGRINIQGGSNNAPVHQNSQEEGVQANNVTSNDGEGGEREPLIQHANRPRNGLCHPKTKKYLSITAIIAAVIIIMLSLGVASCITHFYRMSTNFFKPHQDEFFGIAGDFILCARQPHFGVFPKVTLEEFMGVNHPDHPNGLPMKVIFLDPRDIIYRNSNESIENYEYVLADRGINRFIVPYHYYDKPFYMWPGSEFNLTHQIISSDSQAAEAVAYLIKGVDSADSFIQNSESNPEYEQKFDLIKNPSTDISWTTQDSDYYFVGVHINGNIGTIFKANLTFNMKYLDKDDYHGLKDSSTDIDSIKDVATFDLLGNKKLILCYLHPLGPLSPPKPNSIHIEALYSMHKANAFTVLFIFFGCAVILLPIVFACIIFLWRHLHIT